MSIPGLSVISVDDKDKGQGIEVETFDGVCVIPESHRYGNCRMLNDYIRLGNISEGEFAAIYKCKDRKTDVIYALKKYKMPEDGEHGINPCAIREINLLSNLKHDNIVNSHGAIAGKKITGNYLLLDYYVISLEELIAKEVASIYEPEVVKCMMKQLFQGLEFIHESFIIHRDINCNNVVFAPDGTLKITGFSSAKFITKGNMPPGKTELIYRAPEFIFRARRYGTPADMWSAGCVFARLLLKKPIFTGNTELQLLKSIVEVLGKPSEKIWPEFNKIMQMRDDHMQLINGMDSNALINCIIADLSIASKELIQDILVYYPKARWTANSALKSSYFREPPRECSLENIMSILKEVITADEPMDLDE